MKRRAATLPAMGHLSTHVLDTMNGCPAAGMRVALQRVDGRRQRAVSCARCSNADGRADGAAARRRGAAAPAATGSCSPWRRTSARAASRLPEPPFLDVVPLDFGIADAAGHYHVPLLVSPWTYSTYRGS